MVAHRARHHGSVLTRPWRWRAIQAVYYYTHEGRGPCFAFDGLGHDMHPTPWNALAHEAIPASFSPSQAKRSWSPGSART